MTIAEALRSEEALLPETFRMLFPKLSEEELEKVQALNTLLHNTQPYENFYIFEKIVLALNGVKPNFEVMEGATPEQIFYAFHILGQFGFEPYFDWEVKQWVKYTLEQNGIFFLPPELKYDGEVIDIEKVKKKAEEGPFPLTDNTIIEIQASKWLSISLYINNMIAKEAWSK